MVVLTYAILATQVYSLFATNPLWANILIIAYVITVVFTLVIRNRCVNKSKNPNRKKDSLTEKK